MPTLVNSEDPDEMLHTAAFHQGLHCLLSEKELQNYLEIITLGSLNIYNVQPQVYCVKPEGRIHYKGLMMCLVVSEFTSLLELSMVSTG